MNFQEQLEMCAYYIQKYAPQYNIQVYSSILGQAILESNKFQSELAVNAHNYFGLKYRPNRCPTSNGIYYKIGSEQNPDGSYTSSAMQWFKFSNMEDGVKGYFDFTNISAYSNLKGVTDPRTYLENIKADKYATSLHYVQNIMNVITAYNLTRFDPVPPKKYYRVQVGAYSQEVNAQAMQQKIKQAGFDCIIKKYDKLYKCQCGAFLNKANAEDLLDRVKAKGFDAFVTYC